VENYGHDVFDLVQTRGIIPPRSWGPIQIRFRPIEIKDYHVRILVSGFVTKFYKNVVLICPAPYGGKMDGRPNPLETSRGSIVAANDASRSIGTGFNIR